MSMKKSNGTIGNWTRDLPACSAVPQPTALTYYTARIRAYNIRRVCTTQSFIGETCRKETTWRPRHRWEDNIKMNLKEVCWEGMDWLDLIQKKKIRLASFCECSNETLGPYNVLGISWLVKEIQTSQEGLSCAQVISLYGYYAMSPSNCHTDYLQSLHHTICTNFSECSKTSDILKWYMILDLWNIGHFCKGKPFVEYKISTWHSWIRA